MHAHEIACVIAGDPGGEAQSTLPCRNLKTQQSRASVILDLFLNKTRAEKSHFYPGVIVFKKLVFSGTFSRPILNVRRFEDRLWEAPFLHRVRVDGRRNRRNKTEFSNFSVAVWNWGVKLCYSMARQIRAFWLVLSWSGFRLTDRFRGNGHKLCIFCFRKPENSKQAWPECHIINHTY